MRFLFFLLLVKASASFCQFEKNYIPERFSDTIPQDLLQLIKGRLDSDKSFVKASVADKEKCKYKCGLYDERTNELIKLFNKDYFLIDDRFTPYLRKVTEKIYSVNPALKNETSVFAYRSEVPNASSFGEGTIAFNLGLLLRLENEDQLAFILCHELAHYHLKHTDLQINKLTEMNFDKKLEKEINQIKKDEYNKYIKLKSLLKEMTFGVTRHSRGSENEADSAGLSYFVHTNYDPYAAIRVMEILDSCDFPLHTTNLDLKKYFNSENYKFNETWLEYDSSSYIYAPDDFAGSDTASTHPDCKKRIKALKRQLTLAGKTASSGTKNQSQTFNDIKTRAFFENIESLYHFRHLGEALYETLVLMEKYPQNAYLNAMVGKCLYGIHQAQSMKEFGKVVDLSDNRYSESYNRFLAFIHNLRLIEIAKISTGFMEARLDDYISDEEFLYALILNSKLSVSNLNGERLIQEYKEKFPKGKYIKQL